MSLTPEQLQAELLQLPPSVRARLAEALLDSLDEPETELDRVWSAEAQRRYEEIKSGAVRTSPSSEVMARARARLNDPR
jgi:putative addiction module component (TIGR02574 family)